MTPEFERLRTDHAWRPEDVADYDPDLRTWFVRSAQHARSTYTDATWEQMDSLLDDSWWYQTRNQIISGVLKRHEIQGHIWDVGGGTGVVARFLNSVNQPAVLVEPAPAGARLAAGRNVVSFCGQLSELDLPDDSIHAVSMFDVLEHLEHRGEMLGEVHRVLKPGGHLVLTLPALQTLWSQFDVEAGHFLRYNKRSIRDELRAGGFDVVRSGYFFALLPLPLLLLRVIPFRLGLRRPNADEATLATSGGILGAIARRIELALATRSPIGSSLIVVARKLPRA